MHTWSMSIARYIIYVSYVKPLAIGSSTKAKVAHQNNQNNYDDYRYHDPRA